MTDPQAERGITPPKKPMPGGFSLEHFVEGTKPEDIEALAQALDRDEPDLSAQPAPLVPPEPKESSFFFSTSRTFNSPEYEAALKTWGRQCAEIAQAQARRVDEVEALWHESNASYYDVLAERDEARSTLAQRDREVLELREALRYCSNQSCGPDWTPEQALVYIKEEARNALASTAQAGAEAERRIREDERGKIEDRVLDRKSVV